MNTNKIIKAKKDSKVKFMLVPRPQKDPLAADNDAPQHVLVPKSGSNVSKLPDFDPTLFVSDTETKLGMLERAQTDSKLLDQDLLQAMSKDFDYNDPNNIIDDDFMQQAGGLIEPDDADMADLDDLFDDEPEIIDFNRPTGSDIYKQRLEDDDYDDEFQDEDEFCEDEDDEDFKKFIQKQRRRQDDSRSNYTGCSMSSSVMRKSQGLQQIDEHFERFYEDSYADDTEIGALDLNEVKGDELLTDIDQIRQLKKEVMEVRKKNHGDDYEPEVISNHHKNAIIGSDSEDEDLVEVEVKKRENRVDCESILSYNSNLFNHPKLIMESRKRTTSLKSNASDISMSTNDNTASSITATLAKLSVRPPNEGPDERKARKKAIKELRSERRQERKQNQLVFKTEHAKLMKQQRSNIPALKLA